MHKYLPGLNVAKNLFCLPSYNTPWNNVSQINTNGNKQACREIECGQKSSWLAKILSDFIVRIESIDINQHLGMKYRYQTRTKVKYREVKVRDKLHQIEIHNIDINRRKETVIVIDVESCSIRTN
jgi:hypothetical protein